MWRLQRPVAGCVVGTLVYQARTAATAAAAATTLAHTTPPLEVPGPRTMLPRSGHPLRYDP